MIEIGKRRGNDLFSRKKTRIAGRDRLNLLFYLAPIIQRPSAKPSYISICVCHSCEPPKVFGDTFRWKTKSRPNLVEAKRFSVKVKPFSLFPWSDHPDYPVCWNCSFGWIPPIRTGRAPTGGPVSNLMEDSSFHHHTNTMISSYSNHSLKNNQILHIFFWSWNR